MSADNIDYADPGSFNGLNLYAYCLNNPVNLVDSTGSSAIAILFGILIGALIGGLVGFTTEFVSQAIEKGLDNINWGQV